MTPLLQVDAEAADEGSGGERKPCSDNVGDGGSTAVTQEKTAAACNASSLEAKSPVKSPGKGGRGRPGQDDRVAEGGVQDAGTPIANRDLRQEIGISLSRFLPCCPLATVILAVNFVGGDRGGSRECAVAWRRVNAC